MADLHQPEQSLTRVLGVAALTTAIVTALSYLYLPEHAATGVAAAFVAITYFLVLRGDDSERVRKYGLSLGGLLELEPIEPKRLVRDALHAIGWAALCAAVIFPFFWAGYVYWWKPEVSFHLPRGNGLLNEALGQLLVIALPEEAFYRGYLLTSLDDLYPARRKILGAPLGPGLLLSSAIFALGHVLTEVHPNRLAVFFPALVFGWLRTRSRGIGSGMLFHAACNLFASFLARGYGLGA